MKPINLSGNRLYIILHFAAWMILLILPLYLLGFNSLEDHDFLYKVYCHVLAYMLLFYVNYFWLTPRYFFKKKKIVYFFILIIIIILLFNMVEWVSHVFPHDNEMMNRIRIIMEANNIKPPSKSIHIFNFTLTSFLVSGLGIGLRYAVKYQEHEHELKELEKERLNSELAFLKNQISPHFFFNTLNNIYSLIQINSNDAQQSVLKLSKLMRYMLYESEQGDVSLQKELEFMRNYVDLMRLRINDKVKLSLDFPDIQDGKNIPPLLFVPFIENAFKHGISYQDNSFIYIKLTIETNTILFVCENSVVQKTINNRESSGIGLENIKKRLNLLYPEKHSMSIFNNGKVFRISLTLNL